MSANPIEILGARERRRRWSIEEKLRIVTESHEPGSSVRAIAVRYDVYAQRHLVECCFSKLKQFRRVATRYEKTARNYLAVVTLAATILWLR